MSLTIGTRRIGDVTVIDAEGSIRFGRGVNSLRPALRDLAARSRNQLLLNLENISDIDSAGLGASVNGSGTVIGGGGNLKLVNPTNRLSRMLQVTNSAMVLEVFDDEAVAIGSFTYGVRPAKPAEGGDGRCCSVMQ